MEYIIALGVAIVGAWWYFTRKPATTATPVVEEAPYKVETVEVQPEAEMVTDAVVEAKPAKAKKATAKKPATARKPRAPKKAK